MIRRYIVPMVRNNELNINSKHPTDQRARILSNLTNRPFKVKGQMCASVEGFFAGVLYPPSDPMRERAFASCYGLSQKMVQNGSKDKVWWDNDILQYGSTEHKNICRMAILECTLQNQDRLDALRSTKGLILKHDTGLQEDPSSFLSRKEFCEILTDIREKLLDPIIY